MIYDDYPTHDMRFEGLARTVFDCNRYGDPWGYANADLYNNIMTQRGKRALSTILIKMILEKKAVKKGLHFSRNPRFSQQQSDVLVECGEYRFHIPPTKEDFKLLPHLGHLDQLSRNPKTRMSLNHAKQLLQQYTGMKEEKRRSNRPRHQRQRPVFKKLGDSFF